MIRTSLTAAACAAALIALAACGGGGGGSTSDIAPIPESDPPEQQQPQQPEQPPTTSLPFPLTSGDRQYAGVDLRDSPLGTLPTVGTRAGATIRYGVLNDGVGALAVTNYLFDISSQGTFQRFASAPALRVIGPSTARERELVAQVVEAVNLSLPLAYRIQIEAPLSGLSLRDAVNSQGSYFRSGRERPNTIHIEFLDCAAYVNCGGASGTTWTIENAGHRNDHAYVQIARGTTAYNIEVLAQSLVAHEILHSLGMDGHVSTIDSIMHPNYIPSGLHSILHPLDREGLQALYGHLEPGDTLLDFGPWQSTSTHIAGNGPHANFGVALRNGYSEPWAHGPAPATDLADNRALLGTVIWDGALVGFSGHQSVTGDALISVDLTVLNDPLPELDGSAVFTDLEYREGGTMWGDGDLGYTINVSGNFIRSTGGDDGVLHGRFYGLNHEGAAGTLERSDLTAAFGASR